MYCCTSSSVRPVNAAYILSIFCMLYMCYIVFNCREFQSLQNKALHRLNLLVNANSFKETRPLMLSEIVYHLQQRYLHDVFGRLHLLVALHLRHDPSKELTNLTSITSTKANAMYWIQLDWCIPHIHFAAGGS